MFKFLVSKTCHKSTQKLLHPAAYLANLVKLVCLLKTLLAKNYYVNYLVEGAATTSVIYVSGNNGYQCIAIGVLVTEVCQYIAIGVLAIEVCQDIAIGVLVIEVYQYIAIGVLVIEVCQYIAIGVLVIEVYQYIAICVLASEGYQYRAVCIKIHKLLILITCQAVNWPRLMC